jgi:hypothetical protein
MRWFSASVIIAIVPNSYDGGPLEIYENVYLVCADDEKSAVDAAAHLGTDEENAGGDLTSGNTPARLRFLGVRKVISVSNPVPYPQDQHPPVTGTELSYSLFRVQSMDAAKSFSGGASADLTALE